MGRQNDALVRQALILGALTGMRSQTPLALLIRRLQGARAARADQPLVALLQRPEANVLLPLFAAGELVGDKLPIAPNRTDALPLLGRIAFGAAVGAALWQWHRQSSVIGALLGGTAAIGGAYGGMWARRLLGKLLPVPDAVLGALEDGFVVANSVRALHG